MKNAHFDDMAWPVPDDEISDVNWRLRHQQGEISINDRLIAASILSAYVDLIAKTNKERNYIVSNIKNAM